jgi:hypothetical protein
MWFLAGYLMKLGLSNKEIAEKLVIEENTARRMCNLMRGSMFFQNCLQKLSGTVEVDRMYPSTKTCSKCGHIQEIDLGQRIYICENKGCGNRSQYFNVPEIPK